MVLKNTMIALYLNASLHVSLAVGCLTLITFMQQGLPLIHDYIGLMALGTLVVYNGLKYGKIWGYQIPISYQHQFILGITLLASFFFLMIFLEMPFAIQKKLVVGFCFVFLYPWVRKLGWLKLFWVSATITYFTYMVPLLFYKQSMNVFVLEGISRFVILSALLLPFEIYDSTRDPTALKTLPQRFGILWAKRFGYVLVLVFVGLVLWSHGMPQKGAALGIALLTLGAIYKTQPNQSKTFTAFWVEALPMVWAGLVYGIGE